LTLSLAASAQDLTYIGSGGNFFVSSETLVYSGGNWIVDSKDEKAVENNGNIMIVGDYKKGSTVVGAASDGKEFVNVYTDVNKYGQVQILSTAGLTDALMSVQRLAAPSAYFNSDFGISVPFKDNVSDLMRSFGKTASEFRGDCQIDQQCGGRYRMTLNKWNNDKIQGDAVPSSSTFKAGDYYFLNLRSSAGLQTAMTGIIGYKGTPSPGAYSATGKSVIFGVAEATFSDMGYNDWKTKLNQYRERYDTYMGTANSTNKFNGKNHYRFGNPYTSNIDISGVSGTSAWLKIMNGGEKTIQQAHDARLIGDFTIQKRTSSYDISWNPATGSTIVDADYYSAKYDGRNWSGNPEALIIRPLETFNLKFPLINSTSLGSRIVDVKVGFSDFHKTFSYPALGPIAPVNGIVAGEGNKALAKTRTSSNVDGFYQAEIFLLKGDHVEGTPVYLVGTNYNIETWLPATTTNNIFLYGMKDEVKVSNSQKTFNEFNSVNYIGKPLSLGFKNLVEGDSYELRFNLYENGIFNNVKNLSDGRFLIKDKLKNTVTEFSTTQSFSFVAGADISDRFDLYWKEASSSTLKKSENVSPNSNTIIYKYESGNKIKFEKEAKFADLEFYEISGKLISSKKDVSTANDYEFDLPVAGMYIVKVVYRNGVVRNLKVIK
jgi:hypothetical protein